MTAQLVRIRGQVQGVWYRGWTVEEAARRGLSGWVRNRLDGSVEALFAGEESMIAEMIEACRQGPPMARVESVVSEPAAEAAPSGFRQRPTE
jgi:acylphosphatase